MTNNYIVSGNLVLDSAMALTPFGVASNAKRANNKEVAAKKIEIPENISNTPLASNAVPKSDSLQSNGDQIITVSISSHGDVSQKARAVTPKTSHSAEEKRLLNDILDDISEHRDPIKLREFLSKHTQLDLNINWLDPVGDYARKNSNHYKHGSSLLDAIFKEIDRVKYCMSLPKDHKNYEDNPLVLEHLYEKINILVKAGADESSIHWRFEDQKLREEHLQEDLVLFHTIAKTSIIRSGINNCDLTAFSNSFRDIWRQIKNTYINGSINELVSAFNARSDDASSELTLLFRLNITTQTAKNNHPNLKIEEIWISRYNSNNKTEAADKFASCETKIKTYFDEMNREAR